MRHYKITTISGAALLAASGLSYLVEDTFATWTTGLLGGVFLIVGLAETWLDKE